MFGFRENADLQAAIRAFYEAEKPTAALCHGVSALIDLELSDGSSLIEGPASRTSRRISPTRLLVGR
jgi:putative intracellular protease/amidase